jgi:hypothetical protein
VCIEASTVLRAVARISSLIVSIWRSLWITIFSTYQRESTVICKAFDSKCSRMSMLEVEATPQSCIPYVQIGLTIVLYMRSLLLV